MQTYPGIPYGAAPGWCFPVFEGSMFMLLALCLVHAWRRNRTAIPYLLGGLVFGVLLEYMEVAGHSYVYGRFGLMVGRAPLDVPICIGAGWAIILYTGRLFSDGSRLELWPAAALDTLLALNIDLSMDVVAYRLHMWHWFWDDTRHALTNQWFGIPYGNFNGWVTVVFFYSGFSRTFERTVLRRATDGVSRRTLIAALALVCSLGVLFVTETYVYPFLVHLGITSGIRLSLIVVGLLAMVGNGWRKRRPRRTGLAPIAVWVPCWFHLYFGWCFFALAFYRENRWMTVAALVNLSVGLGIHAAPYLARERAEMAKAA